MAPAEDFSQARAWEHFEVLAALGPRPAGSLAAAKARDSLRRALGEQGFEVREQRVRVEERGSGRTLETVNLVASLPGDSPDVILLVAPYDSPGGEAVAGVAADAGASGAALVLELARALGVRRRPYTLKVAFVEGDALARGGSDGPVSGPWVGSIALAAQLAREGGLDRVRVAAYFDRVAVRDLRVARDLPSNRAWREEFFAAGRRLGKAAVFPADAPFESVEAGSQALLAAGLRRTVAISGTRLGAAATGAPSGAVDLAGCAPESLGAVGAVSLDALATISARLAKIDRFASSPIAAEPAEDAAAPKAQEPTPPVP